MKGKIKLKIAVLMPENATKSIFITPLVQKELAKLGDVTYNETSYIPAVMAEMIADADICVTGWGCPPLNEEIIKNASKLRLVMHTGGSVAPIISPELYERGITVISGNELYAESVADGTLAYILAGLRNITYFNKLVHSGGWRDGTFSNRGLLDRTIGLVGYGAITRYLIPLLKPFRTKIILQSRHLSDEEFQRLGAIRAESREELFSSCDVVSLHLARTTETYHIINKELLALMPDGALLVNTARGSVVDETALEDELISGRISAVLDVFEEEPLPASSRLRGLENVILIPHMAGPTGDRYENVSLALIEDAIKMFNGESPIYQIDYNSAIRMTNDSAKLPGKNL